MKNILLTCLCILVSSCYVYRPLEVAEGETPPTIEKEILPKKYYKIQANGKEYKVETVEWEGDSLVTLVNMKENRKKKFHKAEITEVKHRVFSKGRSDAATFGAYGLGAALLLFLLR